jgi:hypothetical protein
MCGIDQVEISPLVREGSKGNLESSNWPLETKYFDMFGVSVPSELAKGSLKLHTRRSWTSYGRIATTYFFSRHSSMIV